MDNETVEQAALRAGVITTTLDSVINWGRKNSIWPMAFGLACCAIEMDVDDAHRGFDISRFGAEVFRGSLRQRQIWMINIAGRVSNKMAPVITPSLSADAGAEMGSISMGVPAATSTGVFNNYALCACQPGDPGGCLRARMPALARAN